jgi:hypothetical protein
MPQRRRDDDSDEFVNRVARPRASQAIHPAALAPDDVLRDCDETHTRRSGPGGQHRNKTATAVVLVHRPTGLSAEASERRSQAENKTQALKRLRLRLALGHRMPADPAGPSSTWRSRTRDRQLVIAATHDDYPALIAEALDHLQETGFEIAAAAKTLGVTGTQLARLFKKCPETWVALNAHRTANGLAALK